MVRLRPPAVGLPCGCFGWSVGGASGYVRCGYHQILHTESSPLSACDCIEHRAAKRGLSAYDFANELWERESLRGSPLPDIASLPETKGTHRRTKRPKRERDRKCECLWLLKKGEWRIEAWCGTHEARAASWKVARQKERNEFGW